MNIPNVRQYKIHNTTRMEFPFIEIDIMQFTEDPSNDSVVVSKQQYSVQQLEEREQVSKRMELYELIKVKECLQKLKYIPLGIVPGSRGGLILKILQMQKDIRH